MENLTLCLLILEKQFLESVELPDEFDSRVKWGSMCPSLNEVRDQGNCGSCWVSFCYLSQDTIKLTIKSLSSDKCSSIYS